MSSPVSQEARPRSHRGLHAPPTVSLTTSYTCSFRQTTSPSSHRTLESRPRFPRNTCISVGVLRRPYCLQSSDRRSGNGNRHPVRLILCADKLSCGHSSSEPYSSEETVLNIPLFQQKHSALLLKQKPRSTDILLEASSPKEMVGL